MTGSTTSNDDFHFALLRVSIIQMLKAEGFDRARPGAIDIVTDLYVRYFNMVVGEVQRVASFRSACGDMVAVQDISLAFANLGIIKPASVLDFDEDLDIVRGSNDRGIQRFKDWCLRGGAPKDARAVALPTPELLTIDRNGPRKPLTLVPEYVNQLKSNAEGSDRSKLRKNDEIQDSLLEELINSGYCDDWIKLLVARQRMDLAKKVAGKNLLSLESLPNIAGFKASVLINGVGDDNGNIQSNAYLPSPINKINEQSPEENLRITKLLGILPVMQPQNRLENITLSFDEDCSDDIINDMQVDEEVLEEVTASNFEGNYVEPTPIASLALDTIGDTKFAELEDMDNTFQRRMSLDYGNFDSAYGSTSHEMDQF